MKYAAYLSRVPRRILFPVVFVFCVVGAYAIHHSVFDIGVLVVFGILGYYMLKLGFSAAPLLIAFILSPIGESAVRQSLLMSSGSPLIFVTRPIALGFFLLTLITIAGIVRRHYRERRRINPKKKEEGQ